MRRNRSDAICPSFPFSLVSAFIEKESSLFHLEDKAQMLIYLEGRVRNFADK